MSEGHELRKRVGLLVARVGALCLSIGVVGTLMVKAGGLGCSSQSEATKTSEDVSVSPPSATSTAGSTAASAAPTGRAQGEEFFPGSKAPAFSHMSDELLSSKPSSSAAPAASQPKPKPTFFPGTKSGIGDFREEAPPQQQNPAPR